MIKAFVLFLVLLAGGYFLMGFKGYRLAPENLNYYKPETSSLDTQKNAFQQYLEQLKFNNKYHPLIVRKKGISAAESMDKSTTNGLKTLIQADKLDQFEKVKKQVQEISDKADSREKIIQEAESV